MEDTTICGLIGFVVKKANHAYAKEKREFMAQGLHVSSLRGMDATGMALVRDPGKTPLVYKKAMTGSDFIFQKKTRALLELVDQCYTVIGHNRSATSHGPGEDENAHPFTFEHITMVHNGHVHNYKDLEVDCPVNVDSAYVAKSLAENGEPGTLEMIQGDFTLIWHNARDKTLNLARNNRRPLFYVEVPEWGGIAWASEYEMLAMLLSRNQIKMTGKFWQPKENIHFKFDLTKELERKSFPFSLKYNLGGGHTTKALTGPDKEVETTKTDGTRFSAGTIWGTTKVDMVSIIRKQNETKTVSEFWTGRPNTDKQIARAKMRLGVLNIRYNAQLGMNMRYFIKYKDCDNRGVAVGFLPGLIGQMLTAEIPNLKEEDYHDLGGDNGSNNFVAVHAINVKYYGTNGVIQVEVDPKHLEAAKRDAAAELAAMGGSKSVALLFRGPGNKMISEARWLQLTKKGCIYCQELIDRKEHEKVFWIDDSPVCPACANDGTISQELNILTGTDVSEMH